MYVATCTQAAADTEQLSFIACIQDDASRTIQVIRDAWSDGGQTPPAEIQTAIDTAAPVVADVGGQLAIWDLRRSVTSTDGFGISIERTSPMIETLSALQPGWGEQPDSGYGPELTNGAGV